MTGVGQVALLLTTCQFFSMNMRDGSGILSAERNEGQGLSWWNTCSAWFGSAAQGKPRPYE